MFATVLPINSHIDDTYLFDPMWYEIRRKLPSGGTKDRIRSLWNGKKCLKL